MVDQPSLLQYPTDYPIKVLGRPSDEFRARVHAVMLKHAPTLDPDRISERLSENGNYLSISYTIVAESNEQIVALVHDLKATEGVLSLV
jgi:putative lipoic acid-binding regulatory protein